MQAIDFVVRDSAGALQRGAVSGDGSSNDIVAGVGNEISLNLRQVDIGNYQRAGNNLQIFLVDGRVITLEGYFDDAGATLSRLFISSDGYLNEVTLVEGSDGMLAQYGPTESWHNGKWSPSDQLVFLEGSEVAAVAGDETVSMLGAGLLAGGGLGGAGLGAAALAGVGVIGNGGGGGGGRTEPTVDGEGTEVEIGGDNDGTPGSERSLTITGTAEPGSTVYVTVGGVTLETTAGDDGKWSVTFEGDNFPGDGDHPVDVRVIEPDGTETDLTGPDVTIDTTPPEVDMESGVQSTGDVVNAEDYTNGVTITGTGEAGASIAVTIGAETINTVVGDDGTWSVTFDQSQVAGGERTTEVTVVSEDAAGNTTTVTETLVIDTVANAIAINEGAIGGNGIVNGVEMEGGVTITGTGTPGATLSVQVHNQSARTVVVDEDGNWSLSFAEGVLPTGQYDANITVTSVDAAGNASSQSGSFRVDTQGSVSFSEGDIAGDGLINGQERSDGVTITGQSEPGSTVKVTLGDKTKDAIVAEDGSWTVDFNAVDIPTGTDTLTVTAEATDSAGNKTSVSDTVNLDTGNAVDMAAIETDNVINEAEIANGVWINGTSDAGSEVTVEIDGETKTAITGSDGTWKVLFARDELPADTESVAVNVRSEDAAGNVAETTANIEIDTVVTDFSQSALGGEDAVINGGEQGAGALLTGTVEPGSTLMISIDGGTPREAYVDGNGNWSLPISASELPTGEGSFDIVATATDAAGNVHPVTTTVDYDTLVNDLTIAPTAGDGTINAREAADGVILTGTVEPGSDVSVTFNGTTYTTADGVMVDDSGTWSLPLDAADIPRDGTAQLVVRAEDAAGNVLTSPVQDVTIDTTISDAPRIRGRSDVNDGTGGDVDGTGGIVTSYVTDDIAIQAIDANGNATEVSFDRYDKISKDKVNLIFDETVPDGSNLVVSATDDAGNLNGTFMAVSDRQMGRQSVTLDNLDNSQFEITAIDLQFAEDADLVITEEQLLALSSTSDVVTISGGSDDTLSVTGVQTSTPANTITRNGETYDVYTLGDDGGMLLVDQDINII